MYKTAVSTLYELFKMGSKSNFFKALTVLILLLFIYSKPTQSQIFKGTLYSYTNEEPILDGEFESDIWIPQTKFDVILYNLYSQADTKKIAIMSVYDNVTSSLSLGVTIPDSTTGGDMFHIIFKTNASAELIVYKNRWEFGAGHDWKFIMLDDSLTEDLQTLPGNELAGFCGATDPLNRIDITAQVLHVNNKEYTLEIAIPLDSGDIEGADVNLTRSESVDFFIWYSDADSGIFTQIKPTDMDFEYCTLELNGQYTSQPGRLYLFLSTIFALPVIIVNFYRKQKHKVS